MEIRVLVKRDGISRVGITEDMTTVSAMVAAFKEAECSAADGRVADGGVRVGFPVRMGGRGGARGKVTVVHWRDCGRGGGCGCRGCSGGGEMAVVFFVLGSVDSTVPKAVH